MALLSSLSSTNSGLDAERERQEIAELVPLLPDDKDALRFIVASMLVTNLKGHPVTTAQDSIVSTRCLNNPSNTFSVHRYSSGAPTYSPPNNPLPSIPCSFSMASDSSDEFQSAVASRKPSMNHAHGFSEDSVYSDSLLFRTFPGPPSLSDGCSLHWSNLNSKPPSNKQYDTPHTFGKPESLLSSRSSSPEPSLVSPTTQASISSSSSSTPPTPHCDVVPVSYHEAQANWPPFGFSQGAGNVSAQKSPSLKSSLTSKSTLAGGKKSARISSKAGMRSFISFDDDSDEEEVQEKLSALPQRFQAERLAANSREVRRNPSLDVPMDVDSLYARSRLGSVDTLQSRSTFRHPNLPRPPHSAPLPYHSYPAVAPTSQSPVVYQSVSAMQAALFSQVQAQAQSITRDVDKHPYHSSLRETVTPLSAYKFPASARDSLMIMPANLALLESPPSDRRRSSSITSYTSGVSHASAKRIGSTLKTVFSFGTSRKGK